MAPLKINEIVDPRGHLQGLLRAKCPQGHNMAHCPLNDYRRIPLAVISDTRVMELLKVHLAHLEMQFGRK